MEREVKEETGQTAYFGEVELYFGRAMIYLMNY